MRATVMLSIAALVVAACAPGSAEPVFEPEAAAQAEISPAKDAQAKGMEPTALSIPTLPAQAASVPTLPPPVYLPEEEAPTYAPTVRADLGPFAAMEENVADGQSAPDFTARVMGGGTFTLSAQRGAPVLLFPTVVGCGDCIFRMEQIAEAYPDYRGHGLKVVILDLFPEDPPEFWQYFADYFGEPEFIWGVVNSTDFVVQYDITSLGTIMLIDAEGNLVFRSEYRLLADDFRKLFDLAIG